MSSIPLNPALIANAAAYNNPLIGIATNICKQPPPGEAQKTVPMNFGFAANPVFVVDLNSGPAPPLSQICSMYIDATNSAHDVSVVFPDTGFTLRCAFGNSKVAPVITGKSTKFFVCLDNNGNTDPTDTVALFANNFFMPEYSSQDFLQSVEFGFGGGFALQPLFLPTQNWTGAIQPPAMADTIIAATKWFITNFDIRMDSMVAMTAGFYEINFFDGPNQFYTLSFYGETTGKSETLASHDGFNYESSGLGNLSVILTDATGLTNSSLVYNFSGGILIP